MVLGPEPCVVPVKNKPVNVVLWPLLRSLVSKMSQVTFSGDEALWEDNHLTKIDTVNLTACVYVCVCVCVSAFVSVCKLENN